MSLFSAIDWYWLAADGRLYSSASQSLVQADDSAYQAWIAAGNGPTAWPKDGGGFQTIAALQAVLAPYGLFADLKGYAADVRYRREIAGTMVGGVAYPTDRETQAKMTAAVVMTQVNPSATFQWKIADGSFVSLDAADMLAVALAVAAHVQAAFAAESDVVAAIDAGTISTKTQVDGAFA